MRHTSDQGVFGPQAHAPYGDTEIVHLQEGVRLVKVCNCHLLRGLELTFMPYVTGPVVPCREGCQVMLPPAF